LGQYSERPVDCASATIATVPRDNAAIKRVKDGRLNGFSFLSLLYAKPAMVLLVTFSPFTRIGPLAL
jgi:hypothetical protein